MRHSDKKHSIRLLTALLSALPLTAGAAGLGKLTVQSAIGQPLRAEVELSASPDELASICKGDNPAAPLEPGHLRGPSRDQGEVYLRQVHGVRHINALAPDQRLTLHRVGLTIIYGDNG